MNQAALVLELRNHLGQRERHGRTGKRRSSVTSQQDDIGRPVITTDTDNGKAFSTIDAYTPLGDLGSQTFGSARPDHRHENVPAHRPRRLGHHHHPPRPDHHRRYLH